MVALYERTVNIGLRVATLLGKSLLLLVLAKYLEPEVVGLYGLLGATIGYALYLVGFDYYTYTNRELINSNREVWGTQLKSQCVLFCMLYVIMLPVLLLIFNCELLPWAVALWFFALLPLEHINQELARLLVAISRPVTASWVIFLRGGVWPLFIALLFVSLEASRSLEVVLLAWALGGMLAACVGLAALFRMRLGGWAERIDWPWIRRGLKVALPFLVATLALRGVFTLDRYWFSHLAGIEVLAAYVLFLGIAGVLGAFLDAGVYAFHYPRLIRSWKDQASVNFRKELTLILLQTLAISIAFALATILFLPLLLAWLDRPVYTDNADLYSWVMFAMVLYGFSMVPHYALYAQGHDRPLVVTHIMVFVFFVAIVWILSVPLGAMAVPYALCVAFGLMLLMKLSAYAVLTPALYRIPLGPKIINRPSHAEQ